MSLQPLFGEFGGGKSRVWCQKFRAKHKKSSLLVFNSQFAEGIVYLQSY